MHGFERVVPQRDVVHPQAAFQKSWDNVVPDVCGGVSRVTWHVPPVCDVIATNNQPTLKRLHILRSTHSHTHLV